MASIIDGQSQSRRFKVPSLHDLERAMVRDFFFLSPELTDEQKLSMRRQQLKYLGWGASYWMIFLLLFGCALSAFAEKQSVTWFSIWFIGLGISMLPYFLLMSHLLKLPQAIPQKQIQFNNLVWSVWLTVVAIVWFSAYLTLEPHKFDGQFHFSRQLFVYFTILALVFVVMFLSPSRIAVFSVIIAGVFVPFLMVAPDLISNSLARGNKSAQVQTYIFFHGQIAIWLLIALLATTNFKRLAARAIIAESEHQRANNFVAAISHDVKQPLTALALKLGILKRKVGSDSPLLADVLQLQQQTTALESLIRASFDLSRLQAGTWTVKAREVPLPDLITKIVDQMQLSAVNKGVSLEKRPVPACLIWTDPDALERILQNLVSNAIKYTPAMLGGTPGSVVVECEERGDSVAITVRDNGIGISAVKHKDIFKEYVQIDNPERDREKGFGLGLSIVDRLANLLDHQIKVDSSEGKGARFSIEVRRVGSIRVDRLHGPSTIEILADPTPNLKDTVVVVIEDDTASREALYELLIEWGCYVIASESASEAIAKLRNDEFSSSPTFILSDYRLRGGKSGLDAITVIRNEIGSAVPAAIWSAESLPEVLQRIAAAGVELLSKPVDEYQLLNLIKRHSEHAAPSELYKAS
jgi:two-component system, sensor histidine kinase